MATPIHSIYKALSRHCYADNIPIPRLSVSNTLESPHASYSIDPPIQHHVEIPQSYLNRSPEDVAWEVREHLLNCDILHNTYPVTRQSHPEHIEAYEQLCLSRGIHHIPTLWSSRSRFCGIGMLLRLPNDDAILLSPDLLELPVHYSLPVIAHELGHLLAPDDNPRRAERKADAIGVRLLGESHSSIHTLKKIFPDQPKSLPINEAISKTPAQRKAAIEQQERYGTFYERQRFIEAQDIHSHLPHIQRLIEKRNAARNKAASPERE